jgi:hypothetical protein
VISECRFEREALRVGAGNINIKTIINHRLPYTTHNVNATTLLLHYSTMMMRQILQQSPAAAGTKSNHQHQQKRRRRFQQHYSSSMKIHITTTLLRITQTNRCPSLRP